jgi:hypothetical protein
MLSELMWINFSKGDSGYSMKHVNYFKDYFKSLGKKKKNNNNGTLDEAWGEHAEKSGPLAYMPWQLD